VADKFIRIAEFKRNKSYLSSFVYTSTRNKFSGRKIYSLIFKLNNALNEFFSFFFIMSVEPSIFLFQLMLRKQGGLNGAYQWVRLKEIRKIVKSLDNPEVIEFGGAGASTIMFAKYSNVISLEEDFEWLNKFKETLYIYRFLNKKLVASAIASLNLVSREEKIDKNGEKICSYQTSPIYTSKKFNIAYIDGPTSWIQEEDLNGYLRDPYGTLPNTTVLELLEKPDLIICDGRRSTISYLLDSNQFDHMFIALKGAYYIRPKVNPYHTFIKH